MDRFDFTDPFTGESLENPSRKTYKVKYSVKGQNYRKTINTLAEGRLSAAQAKEKLLDQPDMLMMRPSDVEVHSVVKVDESERMNDIPGV